VYQRLGCKSAKQIFWGGGGYDSYYVLYLYNVIILLQRIKRRAYLPIDHFIVNIFVERVIKTGGEQCISELHKWGRRNALVSFTNGHGTSNTTDGGT
jgi:hypothetical protein